MAIQSIPAVRLTPSASKVATPENYLSLTDMDYFIHQSPELDKKLHGRYGSQSIEGWLDKMGRKIPYASDVISWTEEERLTQLIDGTALRTGDVFTSPDHTFRPNEVIMVRNSTGSVVRQGLITATTNTTFTARCGDALGWTALPATGLTIFADFNEFKKKTAGMSQSLNTKYQQYETGGTIVKEMVDESRTNLTQISWLEMQNSDGEIGNVWFYVNKDNAERRFLNARESASINSKKWAGDLLADGYTGKQGLIDVFRQGNIFSGLVTTLTDIESVVDRFEKQGQLKDNVWYGTTAFCFGQDNLLASTNTVGLSYGSFMNDQNMFQQLSFKGYERGGYRFDYSPLRYLNEPTAQGSMVGVNKINAFCVPSASQSVTDKLMGTTSMKPMIHIRNRALGSLNRDYEMAKFDWASGTNNIDAVRTEFQSEQAIVIIGRNNTLIAQG
jgi:hypothetical protein